jgi:hypothetical protein
MREAIMAATRRTPPLRAVKDDETPVVAKPKSVKDAATSGDHRALLVAMRDRIAATVSDPKCPPRDLASLTRRLQDIAREIESIDLRAKEEGDEDSAAPDEAWDDQAL